MNIPFIMTAQYAGRLRRRLQPVVIVVSGCLVGAVGVAVLALLSDTTSFAVAFVGYVFVGIGWGTLVPGVVNVAMRDVPPGVSGGASGLVNAARQVGTSVGLAVLGTIGVRAATSTWASRTRRGARGGRTGAVRGRGPGRHSDACPRFAVPTRCGGRLRVGVPPGAARRRRFDARRRRRGRGGAAFRRRRRRRRRRSGSAGGGRRGGLAAADATRLRGRCAVSRERDAAQDAQAATGAVVGELARGERGAIQLVGRAPAVRRVGEHVMDGQPAAHGATCGDQPRKSAQAGLRRARRR